MPNTNTPLHIAAQNGNAEIVKMFLDARVDPNVKNADGQTPLHLAVQMGHVEVAALLVEKTKPQNCPTVEEQTPPTPLQSSANHAVAMSDTPPIATIGALVALIFFVIVGLFSILGSFVTEEEPTQMENLSSQASFEESPSPTPPQRSSPLTRYYTTPGYTNVLSPSD